MTQKEYSRRWYKRYSLEVEHSINRCNHLNAIAPVKRYTATEEEIKEFTQTKTDCHRLVLAH